jgi:hypothetical protein
VEGDGRHSLAGLCPRLPSSGPWMASEGLNCRCPLVDRRT